MASCAERRGSLELLQSQRGEGPCVECYLRGVPVVSGILHGLAERCAELLDCA